MNIRIKVSIIICVIFLILSSAITAFNYYINVRLPGVSSKSFAPVTVNKVPEDEDIVVQVYQTGIARHNDQCEYSNPEMKITDLSARHGEETADPFESSNRILIMSYSVESELNKLEDIQSGVLCCGAVNIAFIILVVGVNLIISAVRRKRG